MIEECTLVAVALAVTVHDPEERLLGRFTPALDQVASLYVSRAAGCSADTSPRTLSALAAAGFFVVVKPGRNVGVGRRDAVAGALAGSAADWIHYVDLDRLLHWEYSHPNELRVLLAGEPRSAYVALGRTARALATHPRVQVVAETLTNEGCGRLLGLNGAIDAVAGSSLFSRQAAEVIMRHSCELTNATDLEWPAIVYRELGVPPEARKLEGLEFETADYYGDEIQAAGSVAAWVTRSYDRPETWVSRTRLAYDSIAALARVLDDRQGESR
ncbi:MAG: hypothetical protein HY329_00100 [Chloroflexi bacterium]|nr:hypothetical protein [Chloroflexota bacterium]